MGLFNKVLSKEQCALCSNECGVVHRTKIKGEEYVCSDCAKKCSKYVRLSELDKDSILEHIEYMKHQEEIYQNYYVNAKKDTYPSAVKKQGISFADELGMFTIIERSDPANKLYHEMFRYDQVAHYEQYVETEKTSGNKEEFKESGVKIRLFSIYDHTDMNAETAQKGMRSHPYIKNEIKVVFATSKQDTDYTDNAIAHFDHLFGVHDDETALFSLRGSKKQQREFKAQKDMSKALFGMVKAARKGELNAENEELKEQFAATMQSTAEARTGGMFVYTQRANEIEEKVNL